MHISFQLHFQNISFGSLAATAIVAAARAANIVAAVTVPVNSYRNGRQPPLAFHNAAAYVSANKCELGSVCTERKANNLARMLSYSIICTKTAFQWKIPTCWL